jgi:ferric-dicitrate binding protein FerR (iron transport regulator)
MENSRNKIEQLLNKAEWTQEEKQWMLRYLEDTDGQELHDIMKQQYENNHKEDGQLDEEITRQILRNVHDEIGVTKKTYKASIVERRILQIAAVFVIVFLVLTISRIRKSDTKREVTRTELWNKSHKNSLTRVSDKALLTLADGSTIVLDDAPDGYISKQGNVGILKSRRKLTYQLINFTSDEIKYNTITTPRGGQYQVELPDGSKVWLNNASSIHFPTAFLGRQRAVEITGEAYFEVAKNEKMPFKVKVNDAEVQVLGTHFNIMAYSDESVLQTTLLEGKVEFVSGSLKTILKPGQQSQLSKDGLVKVVSGVDLNEVVAWRNGMFDFKGSDLMSVARQLSRWYNVEIIFDKKVDDLFYAQIPRDTKLKDVLKALELTGKVRFEIKGEKIIVKTKN